MRNDRLEELENAVALALVKVRELSVEGALPPVLQPLNLIAPPRGFHVQVHLKPYQDHARMDERVDTRWDARNGEVQVFYEPSREDDRYDDAPMESLPPPPEPEEARADLVRVLARAESDPNFKFVALKFLRDQLLPRSVAWALIPYEAQTHINAAIDEGLLATSKVENPRQPQYPVTAVQLNRLHPFVQRVLGDAQPADPAI